MLRCLASIYHTMTLKCLAMHVLLSFVQATWWSHSVPSSGHLYVFAQNATWIYRPSVPPSGHSLTACFVFWPFLELGTVFKGLDIQPELQVAPESQHILVGTWHLWNDGKQYGVFCQGYYALASEAPRKHSSLFIHPWIFYMEEFVMQLLLLWRMDRSGNPTEHWCSKNCYF